MAKVLLKDICDRITDGSHNPPTGVSRSSFLMISSKNIDDDFISLDNPRYLSEEEFKSENQRTNIQTNDLLMTIVGTIGRVAVVQQGMTNICLQRSVGVLKPKSDIVNPRFLMYQLQSMRPLLEKEAHGVAQKGIYLKQVEQLSVLVPTMEEQQHIIATLDKLSSLISLRKQQLAKLDELVKARFVEMFGDPIINPFNWKQATLKDVAIGKLSYGSGASSCAYDGHTRYVRITDIDDNGRLNSDIVSPSVVEEKYLLNDGDN